MLNPWWVLCRISNSLHQFMPQDGSDVECSFCPMHPVGVSHCINSSNSQSNSTTSVWLWNGCNHSYYATSQALQTATDAVINKTMTNNGVCVNAMTEADGIYEYLPSFITDTKACPDWQLRGAYPSQHVQDLELSMGPGGLTHPWNHKPPTFEARPY
jgi:hypothetical protein